ncbi:c-type cytochrome [Bradyrhizobium sp. LHD-71]|uniref:c-type cytochrome n=1 Tax=Bradyrhizobium sp. LHD-71 TaxID=3072141 RepID=UPI0028100CD9|nr:c-type cytochrome [Bradyrhizobium sp. LHD-71]MDQ8726278.1 c-type cytochrome [Bradyrhizobium sp. LHD-71]
MPALAALALWLGTNAAPAQLRGHGGPVRALTISKDGTTLLSGSFDGSAIRWSLTREAAEQVLRFHDDAVNATALFKDGRAATAGADGRIAIWSPGRAQPDKVLEGHTAPVAAIALSPDGATLASASWDHTVRLWPVAGGAPRVLEGHTQNVNGIAFTAEGGALVTASYDLTVRIWPLDGRAPSIVTLPAPLNAVTVADDGEIAAAGADGKVHFLTRAGEVNGEVALGPAPVVTIALSHDGAMIAAADIRGSVAIVERKSRTLARRLVGADRPLWSLAFLPDNVTLLTGGTDALIRRWNALTGEPLGATVQQGSADPLAAHAGDRGAEIFRACIACHTLAPDQGNRAGPTLAGVFGRRIATLPGYNFSEPLKKLDIIWTPETVSKLFEVGPSTYTPGTKMPEQVISSAEDRRALVEFLQRVTKR